MVSVGGLGFGQNLGNGKKAGKWNLEPSSRNLVEEKRMPVYNDL